jgi:hypothetical protein
MAALPGTGPAFPLPAPYAGQSRNVALNDTLRLFGHALLEIMHKGHAEFRERGRRSPPLVRLLCPAGRRSRLPRPSRQPAPRREMRFPVDDGLKMHLRINPPFLPFLRKRRRRDRGGPSPRFLFPRIRRPASFPRRRPCFMFFFSQEGEYFLQELPTFGSLPLTIRSRHGFSRRYRLYQRTGHHG